MLDDAEQKRMRIDPETCRDPDLLAAEVRRLQGVIAAGKPTLTDEEREAVHRLCRAVTHYSADGVAVDGGSFARDDERAVAVVRGWLARLT